MKTERPSIWKRDLWETKPGRFLAVIVFPVLTLIWGLSAIITGNTRVRGVKIEGFDSVLFGVGLISFLAATYALAWYGMNRKKSYRKGITILLFGIAIIALFAFSYDQF